MRTRFVRGQYGGQPYEYYPLGEHVVCAPGVCGGRPTFKDTRIEAAGALNLAAVGLNIDDIASRYGVPIEAIREAIRLAGEELNGLKRAA